KKALSRPMMADATELLLTLMPEERIRSHSSRGAMARPTRLNTEESSRLAPHIVGARIHPATGFRLHNRWLPDTPRWMARYPRASIGAEYSQGRLLTFRG